MSKGLFIIGTGTDVGKTYVSGLILKALNKAGKSCAYFKGAMSGNDRAKNGTLLLGDALTVQKLSNISQPLSTMCPYGYETAVSPHLAAKLEGNPVDLQVITHFQTNILISWQKEVVVLCVHFAMMKKKYFWKM